MVKRSNKRPSRKVTEKKVAAHGQRTVWRGKLVPPAGCPGRVMSLFKVVAEKIPFDCLQAVEYDMKDGGLPRTGIYLAHDSMGAVRYAGRGSIFTRLATRKKEQFLQLHYFSFYRSEEHT